jgi:DinB superfamily
VSSSVSWLLPLETGAPDVVACWRVADSLRLVRRELRARAGAGSADRVLTQQEAIADALGHALRALPEAALRIPGGEADWNVAETFAHATAARRWLPRAAALSASGEWPEEAPVVQPGIPGRPDATREELLVLLEKSRRSMALSARQIAGHETDRCPLDHPLIGRLRCGEWLLWAGVHDLMHLEQLDRIATSAAGHG